MGVDDGIDEMRLKDEKIRRREDEKMRSNN
jgi:hypothetical protein